ncbi:hypothetical protein GGS26DRAFT_121081 [Hypomontagnella submonticulosa]|nr:hypothetical protein GGS26DRAFT_121081 [Hypomontagnella submonticulosa]
MATTPLHVKILSVPAARQDESPLFGILPAEIRIYIFSLALTDYPDPSPDKHYDESTCYKRPHYFAPRKSDTALLRTCRAAYAECWFLPFVLHEQTHWLTSWDRAPPEYGLYNNMAEDIRSQLAQIKEQRGDDEIIEIEQLRIFAQMYKLEGHDLSEFLEMSGLRPRRLTLTIRHADWWYWENDAPLRFEAGWIKAVCDVLPSSVREICIELESLERKKDQVDSIAKQMRERWFFKRTDGIALFADVTGGNDEVSRWSGTSTWHHKTWTRDETVPGRIDYYVVCVPFRLRHIVERKGGRVSDEAKHAAQRGVFEANKMRLHIPKQEMSEDEDEDEDEDDVSYQEESDWDDNE